MRKDRPRAEGQGPKTMAARIIRLYPGAWRGRYEPEMLALVEQSSIGGSSGTVPSAATARLPQ
jgi:hypothetical protein